MPPGTRLLYHYGTYTREPRQTGIVVERMWPFTASYSICPPETIFIRNDRHNNSIDRILPKSIIEVQDYKTCWDYLT